MRSRCCMQLVLQSLALHVSHGLAAFLKQPPRLLRDTLYTMALATRRMNALLHAGLLSQHADKPIGAHCQLPTFHVQTCGFANMSDFPNTSQII